MSLDQKISIRKIIVLCKRALKYATSGDARSEIIDVMNYNKNLLNSTDPNLNADLPTFGKFKMIIEKDLEEEQRRFDNDFTKSDVDLKRLALKQSFLEYYNNLNYAPDIPIADFESDMTLRRDDKDVDKTDYDFAPNKNEIYGLWIEKLNRYIREEKLNKNEYDEAVDRGTPQGGAFEKQLDRYRKDIMQKLWQDYHKQRKG